MHWRWVHEENHSCTTCEENGDRGFDGSAPFDGWDRAALALSRWWHGAVVSVLRRRASRLGGGVLVRLRGASPATSTAASDADFCRYFRGVAEDYDWRYLALVQRGPVWSVPEWEASLVEHDEASRAAWAAYADALFG